MNSGKTSEMGNSIERQRKEADEKWRKRITSPAMRKLFEGKKCKSN
jgi:hypothetical protein